MSQKKLPKILIAAGGSGGHLFSAQMLAEKLQGKADLIFIGKGLKKNPFFHKKNYKCFSIFSGPIVKNFRSFVSLGAILLGCIQSIYYLLTLKPTLVVGFGSFHTFPILLMAKIMRKKVLLFEANCLVGQVNRLIASKKISLACQLPQETQSKNVPIIQVKPFPFKATLGPMPKKKGKTPSILIFGGSQGASYLNEIFTEIVKEDFPFIIHHIAGNETSKIGLEKMYKSAGIDATVYSFVQDMEKLYLDVNLVICRAGALTIAELIHYKIPAILIPYPFAKDDHQTINGKYFEKIGGGKVFMQKDLSPQKLKKAIIDFLENKRYATLLNNLLNYQLDKGIELDALVLELCKKTPTFTF